MGAGQSSRKSLTDRKAIDELFLQRSVNHWQSLVGRKEYLFRFGFRVWYHTIYKRWLGLPYYGPTYEQQLYRVSRHLYDSIDLDGLLAVQSSSLGFYEFTIRERYKIRNAITAHLVLSGQELMLPINDGLRLDQLKTFVANMHVVRLDQMAAIEAGEIAAEDRDAHERSLLQETIENWCAITDWHRTLIARLIYRWQNRVDGTASKRRELLERCIKQWKSHTQDSRSERAHRIFHFVRQWHFQIFRSWIQLNLDSLDYYQQLVRAGRLWCGHMGELTLVCWEDTITRMRKDMRSEKEKDLAQCMLLALAAQNHATGRVDRDLECVSFWSLGCGSEDDWWKRLLEDVPVLTMEGVAQTEVVENEG